MNSFFLLFLFYFKKRQEQIIQHNKQRSSLNTKALSIQTRIIRYIKPRKNQSAGDVLWLFGCPGAGHDLFPTRGKGFPVNIRVRGLHPLV